MKRKRDDEEDAELVLFRLKKWTRNKNSSDSEVNDDETSRPEEPSQHIGNLEEEYDEMNKKRGASPNASDSPYESSSDSIHTEDEEDLGKVVKDLATEKTYDSDSWDLHQEAKHEAQWNERFERLKEFKRAYGHLYVPRKTEKQLNRWCITQRAYRRDNKLSADRVAKLDSIGFQWGRSDSRQTEWDKQFERMRQFISKHGHSSVPVNVDKKLNKWVEKQRASRKNGIMNQDRIQRLDSIGFQWHGRDYAKDWLQNLDQLKAFRSLHGHIDIPDSASDLSKWLKYQISLKRKGLLSQEKVKKLEELGVSWQETKVKDGAWDISFHKLKAFKEEHGNFSLPPEHELFQWLLAQKKAKKQNLLSKNKVKKLESIGLEWPNYSKWLINFQSLKQFRGLTGHLNVGNRQLSEWMEKQRQSYHNHSLKQEKIRMLEAIGFSWGPDVEDPEWTQKYLQLQAFVSLNSEGPLMVDKTLYTWLRKQVVARENGMLTKEHLRKLDNLGIWNRIEANSSRVATQTQYIRPQVPTTMDLSMPQGKDVQMRTIVNVW